MVGHPRLRAKVPRGLHAVAPGIIVALVVSVLLGVSLWGPTSLGTPRTGGFSLVAADSGVFTGSEAGGAIAARGGGSYSSAVPATLGWPAQTLRSAPRAPIDNPEPGIGLVGATLVGPAPSNATEVLVTLAYSNQSRLEALLSQISDPSSPQYHKYLTQEGFDQQFGGTPAVYQSALAYFESYGVTDVGQHPDRTSLSFLATPDQLASIFGTRFGTFSLNGRTYFAPVGAPTLPGPLSPDVVGVVGLSDYATNSLPLVPDAGSASSPVPVTPDGTGDPNPCSSSGGPFSCVTVDGRGYPAPAQSIFHGQLLAPSDLQVTYDLDPLYDHYGYAAGTTVATILWGDQVNTSSGTGSYCQSLTTGTWASDFYLPDVTGFLQNTLPSGEPVATPVGVQIAGAGTYANGPDGESATCDQRGTNGAALENTLDMDMLGTIAPGATMYQVYGQGVSTATTDTAFADILSPSTSDGPGFTSSVVAGLGHVLVISNSWISATPVPDGSWDAGLMQAQARGISVLAATGDSGGDFVSTPAAAAFGTYGVTAVGGTALVINSTTLARTSETVWYSSTPKPAGTVAGVDTDFAEPSWQAASGPANTAISAVASGRGEADLAAIAATVPLTLTYYGVTRNVTSFQAQPNQALAISGTSISTPTVAGIVAMFDIALAARGDPPIGFLDPTLYSLGDLSFCDPGLAGIYDVTMGSNAVYPAGVGYDLPSGWGVLDAAVFESWIEAPLPYSGFCHYIFLHPALHLPWLPWLVDPCIQCSVPLTIPPLSESAEGEYEFSVPNGTYEYVFVAPEGEHTNVTPVGTLDVTGSNLSLNLSFVKGGVANIRFTETGLPKGTIWCSGVMTLVCTGSASVVVPNLAQEESYPYYVLGPPGFGTTVKVDHIPVPPSGSVVLGTKPVAVSIVFKPVEYLLTVSDNGTSASHPWTVRVTGVVQGHLKTEKHTTKLDAMTFELPNGTFALTVTPPKGYGGGVSENLSITAGPASVSVTFVNLGELGRPPATSVGPSAPTTTTTPRGQVVPVVTRVRD